jgi:hypothetical protein
VKAHEEIPSLFVDAEPFSPNAVGQTRHRAQNEQDEKPRSEATMDEADFHGLKNGRQPSPLHSKKSKVLSFR